MAMPDSKLYPWKICLIFELYSRFYTFKSVSILIGFPFAKLLRNSCGTKRKLLFPCASVLREKKQQFAQSFAKLPQIAKLKFCTIPQLEFCSIPQFRKNQTVGDGVFFRIQFWKNLVSECLPIGHFYIIDQWQLRRVQISQFSRQF